jgi:hypothetical protein
MRRTLAGPAEAMRRRLPRAWFGGHDGRSSREFLIGTETKPNIVEFFMGLRKTARRAMHLSLAEALLAVSALGTAFLLEIFVFVALGLI